MILSVVGVIAAQYVLLHGCHGAFDSCERALEAALFESSPTLPTRTSSTWIRANDRCINDLQPGLRIGFALSAAGLLRGIWIARELLEVLETFSVLMVVGGDVCLVFRMSRVRFIAERACEGAECGPRRLGLFGMSVDVTWRVDHGSHLGSRIGEASLFVY